MKWDNTDKSTLKTVTTEPKAQLLIKCYDSLLTTYKEKSERSTLFENTNSLINPSDTTRELTAPEDRYKLSKFKCHPFSLKESEGFHWRMHILFVYLCVCFHWETKCSPDSLPFPCTLQLSHHKARLAEAGGWWDVWSPTDLGVNPPSSSTSWVIWGSEITPVKYSVQSCDSKSESHHCSWNC